MSEAEAIRVQLTAIGEQLCVLSARLNKLEGVDRAWVFDQRMSHIIKAAADITGIPATDILSERRGPEPMLIRWAIIRTARLHTYYSYPRIGRALRRHHTSIMHSDRRAADRYTNDPDFRALCDRVAALFLQRFPGPDDAAAHHPA